MNCHVSAIKLSLHFSLHSELCVRACLTRIDLFVTLTCCFEPALYILQNVLYFIFTISLKKKEVIS